MFGITRQARLATKECLDLSLFDTKRFDSIRPYQIDESVLENGTEITFYRFHPGDINGVSTIVRYVVVPTTETIGGVLHSYRLTTVTRAAGIWEHRRETTGPNALEWVPVNGEMSFT